MLYRSPSARSSSIRQNPKAKIVLSAKIDRHLNLVAFSRFVDSVRTRIPSAHLHLYDSHPFEGYFSPMNGIGGNAWLVFLIWSVLDGVLMEKENRPAAAFVDFD